MILLRPICWLLGHKRGKEAELKGDGFSDDRRVFQARGAGLRLFRCPRCSRETRYRIKPQPAPVSESQDEAFTYGRNPKQDEQEDRRLDSPQHNQAKSLNRKYE